MNKIIQMQYFSIKTFLKYSISNLTETSTTKDFTKGPFLFAEREFELKKVKFS